MARDPEAPVGCATDRVMVGTIHGPQHLAAAIELRRAEIADIHHRRPVGQDHHALGVHLAPRARRAAAEVCARRIRPDLEEVDLPAMQHLTLHVDQNELRSPLDPGLHHRQSVVGLPGLVTRESLSCITTRLDQVVRSALLLGDLGFRERRPRRCRRAHQPVAEPSHVRLDGEAGRRVGVHAETGQAVSQQHPHADQRREEAEPTGSLGTRMSGNLDQVRLRQRESAKAGDPGVRPRPAVRRVGFHRETIDRTARELEVCGGPGARSHRLAAARSPWHRARRTRRKPLGVDPSVLDPMRLVRMRSEPSLSIRLVILVAARDATRVGCHPRFPA